MILKYLKNVGGLKARRTLFLIIVGVSALFWLVPFVWGKNNISPRVYLGASYLGGGLVQAEDAIMSVSDNYEKKNLILVMKDKKVSVAPAEIGLKIDRNKTIASLKESLGLNEFSPKYCWRFWQSLVFGYDVPIYYSFDMEKFREISQKKLGTIFVPVADANIKVEENNISVVSAREGTGIDEMFAVAQVIKNLKEWKNNDIQIRLIKVEPEITTEEALSIKNEIEKLVAYPFVFKARENTFKIPRSSLLSWIDIKKQPAGNITEASQNDDVKSISNVLLSGQAFQSSKKEYRINWDINREAIGNFLKREVEGTIYQKKVNGVLVFEGGAIKEIQPSQSGTTVDAEKSLDVIASSFKNSEYFIDLPVVENPADISLKKAVELGVNTLVGKGESNFIGSPNNRKHNIRVGASKFNGAVIGKDEVFSFLKTLGPVDQSTGYLPELVIKKDKTVPEYGGGMCQVSSTCFRAAVNSGLRVTERQNHAYPVQYYSPQGTDATVYIPKPDLKFVNDTPGPIIIQTRIEGNMLYFDFFGQTDGRKVELEGPRTWDKKSDGSMKAEWIQRVYDKSGKLMFQKNFLSKYESPSKFPHPGDEKPPTDKKKKKKH